MEQRRRRSSLWRFWERRSDEPEAPSPEREEKKTSSRRRSSLFHRLTTRKTATPPEPEPANTRRRSSLFQRLGLARRRESKGEGEGAKSEEEIMPPEAAGKATRSSFVRRLSRGLRGRRDSLEISPVRRPPLTTRDQGGRGVLI